MEGRHFTPHFINKTMTFPPSLPDLFFLVFTFQFNHNQRLFFNQFFSKNCSFSSMPITIDKIISCDSYSISRCMDLRVVLITSLAKKKKSNIYYKTIMCLHILQKKELANVHVKPSAKCIKKKSGSTSPRQPYHYHWIFHFHTLKYKKKNSAVYIFLYFIFLSG